MYISEQHAANYIGGCHVVVDIGHAFTHVVPFFQGKPALGAAMRVDVGGAFLTEQLKEAISFRQYNMMDETYIINQVKERCCFVSSNFERDLKRSKQRYPNGVTQWYVLPDYSLKKEGYVKPENAPRTEDEQVRHGIN
jgi:actin-related protein 6